MTSLAQKNRSVGIRAALFGLAMLGLAFAVVPPKPVTWQKIR